MQDDFDADGYEPEHDQYLDNDEDPAELQEAESDLDDELDSEWDQEELDPDFEEDLDEGVRHWDDL